MRSISVRSIAAVIVIGASFAGVPRALSAQAGRNSAGQAPAIPTWTIVPQSTGDLGLTFTLGWTLGTHEGKASQVMGSMQAQADPLAIAQAEFRVPITSMSTGNTNRDCHMREALGIEYKGSQFPASHVCANGQTPASGPDSVVFPEVVIKIRSWQATGGSPVRLSANTPVQIQVPLEFTIHGMTHDIAAPLRLQLMQPDTVQAQAEFDMKLADFGIVVKMPPLQSVEDHAKVKLNLLLRRN